jgi:hypothetical protein
MVGQIMMMRKDQQMVVLGSLEGTGEELQHVLQHHHALHTRIITAMLYTEAGTCVNLQRNF